MGSSAAMIRDEIIEESPPLLNVVEKQSGLGGTPPSFLSFARVVNQYKKNSEEDIENSAQRLEFIRKVCIQIFGSLKVFQDIINEADIVRGNYNKEGAFQQALQTAKEIRGIIIEIFGSIEKAKEKLLVHQLKKSGKKDVEINLDDIYDPYKETVDVNLWRDLDLQGPYIERVSNGEITDELIKEAADHHRLIFGNTMHFVKCNDCNVRKTAREIFGLEKKGEFIPLEQMDNSEINFKCPCCAGKMERIHDPEKTYRVFSEKLRGNGTIRSFVSVLRRRDNSIGGMAFAYVTSVGRERKLEWDNDGDPYMRKSHKNEKEEEIEKKFLECLNDEIFPYHGNIRSHKEVIAWNHISVSPDMTGSMLELTYDLFDQIPKGMQSMLVLGDVKKGSVAHRFFRKLGGKDGTSFFGPDSDVILIGGKASDAIEYLKTIHD